jgi:type II secretory pathway component PulM
VTPRARKLLAYGIAVLVLLAVFALYTRPTILVTLADQIWACFR